MKKPMFIAACLVLPFLAACAAQAPEGPPGPTGSTGSSSNIPVQVTLGLADSNPRFIHSNFGLQDAADQALLQGTLVAGPKNYLGVKTEENSIEFPAFPGTTVLTSGAGEAPGIEIQGHTYALGEEVKFSGGFSVVSAADHKAIADCWTDLPADGIFLIQQISN